MNRRDLLALGVVALLASVLPRDALAQSKYPDRPIRLIVPFAPGGLYDSTARPWVESVKPHLGTVVAENMGGGGGSLGAAAVARAQPDGYTILFGGTPMLVVNPIASTRLPYHPVKDFEPIAILGYNADPDRRASRAAGPDAEGARRLRQGQSRETVIRIVRHRFDESSGRRAVQVADRNRHPARALSRCGAGDDRPDQRPHPDGGAERERGCVRTAQGREAARSRRRPARSGSRPTFRRSRRPDFLS